MDLDIVGLLRRKDPDKKPGRSMLDSDSLIICCKDCELEPLPGSVECLRCMVECMSSAGSANRIILRTGKDLEISGRSCDAVRQISSLRRWSVPLKESGKGCSRCNRSRKRIMEDLWASFPDLGYSAARSALSSEGMDERCSRCTSSSLKALDQMERDMESIRKGLGW
jgi:hypothetical protein